MTATGRPAATTTGALAAVAHPAADRRRQWLDRIIGSDPGLNRLRMALQCVLTTALAIAAEEVFVHLTQALQVDTRDVLLTPAQLAAVRTTNHGALVIAAMLGAVVGMIGSFAGPMEPTPGKQVRILVTMPVPMIGALALGVSLGSHRTLVLVSLPLLLAIGTYCRRFGPLGFLGGQLLFMGDFIGFLLHGVIATSALGWLSAEIGLATLIVVACHFLFFAPNQRKALQRIQHSYAARARAVADLAVKLCDSPAGGDLTRPARRLNRHLIRLNETALMIDAQLADPDSLPEDSSALQMHQRLFDAELALSNAARFAIALARFDVPDQLRQLVRRGLVDLRDDRLSGAELAAHELLDELRVQADGLDRTLSVLLHRYGVSVVALVAALGDWRDACEASEATAAPFEASVTLFGGWLPGSTLVSARASAESGPHLFDRIILAPYIRSAIQLGVAVGLAIVLGDLLSGERFYWAVIAAFVTFVGTNNSGEQVRKSLLRVAGTFVGIMIGALLAHLVGTHTALSVVVILVSLFFGMYLMRVNYAFLVIGITVMVSQLYVQLDEFSNSLLVLRLEETALGAGVAIVTVLLVLPLRTRQVVRVAVREHIVSLAEVTEKAVRRLVDPLAQDDLRAAARQLDANYQALRATAQPLRIPFTSSGDGPLAQYLRSAFASRHYARNLVVDAAGACVLDKAAQGDLQVASRTLASSLAELVEVLETGPSGRIYVRSAALFDIVATRAAEQDYLAPTQLVLRDLQLIDGVMAMVAEAAGLSVRDLDTAVVAH